MKKALQIIAIFLIFIIFLVIINHIYQKEEKELDLLVVVNIDNKLESDVIIKTVEFKKSLVNELAYEQLVKMNRSAGRDKIYLEIDSAYISYDHQRKMFDDKVTELMGQGKNYEEALNETLNLVYYPGYSEQQTGLIIVFKKEDINKHNEMLLWLDNNAYKYGFIKRYPEDKENITNVKAKNNYYRFVGIENAKIMYDNNLCLEEYVKGDLK